MVVRYAQKPWKLYLQSVDDTPEFQPDVWFQMAPVHPPVLPQAVREQQIYQTMDPLTKAEEQLFEGTLSDKKNEEQPVFSETKQEIAEQKTAEYLKTAVDSEGNRKQIEQNKNVISEEIRPQQLELFEEKLLAPESRSRHQLIGQIFDTYWLVQFEDKFFIIDQHAAHEKVYYERFVKRFREQTVESQYLSPPLIVSLNLQEEALPP